MTDQLNLDTYLRHLGYQGDRSPTLETLAELQRRHVATFPFENLSPYLGDEVSLDTGALATKLLRDQRGGYCFEHNVLFENVLRQLGFQVRGLAARVFWNADEDARPPVTHMLLRVEIDGRPWLVDTGFGALTPTGPVRLDSEREQRTPHEPFRVYREGPGYRLEARLGDHWRLLYRFDLREMWLADYQMISWYLSHHPESLFVTNLVAARVDPDRRHTLLNRRYTVRFPNGDSESRDLEDADQVLAVLEDVFRVRVGGKKEALRRRLALETEGVVR